MPETVLSICIKPAVSKVVDHLVGPGVENQRGNDGESLGGLEARVLDYPLEWA